MIYSVYYISLSHCDQSSSPEDVDDVYLYKLETRVFKMFPYKPAKKAHVQIDTNDNKISPEEICRSSPLHHSKCSLFI
jgi:hypothetical protein